MHAYTPFGIQYYESILDSFLQQMKKFENEYEMLYIISDSNWEIPESDKYKVIKVNSSLRYYNAYKEVLPQIKEDLVLLLDNDFIIYREGIIRGSFLKLEPSLNNADTYDVVSIIDDIGTFKTDKLKNGNKFCPYFFATRKELLMKYLDVDWSSDMPYCETFGHLTEKMLEDGIKCYEQEEDKSSLMFDGSEMYPNGTGKSKDLGYYHCRNGSLASVLLAWKGNALESYNEYLKNQPKTETLRLCAWYQIMGGESAGIIQDLGISLPEWVNYCSKAWDYHFGKDFKF